MTKKRSLKTFFTVGGGSSLSTLSAVCGAGCAGACGVACLPLCAVPVTSVFGISSALLTSWMNHLLPVLTALSAVAFTMAYFNLYKKQESDCCSTEQTSKTKAFAPNYSKIFFWVGLILTTGLYIQAVEKNFNTNSNTCNVNTCELLPEKTKQTSLERSAQAKADLQVITFLPDKQRQKTRNLAKDSSTKMYSHTGIALSETKTDTSKHKKDITLIKPISTQPLEKLQAMEFQTSIPSTSNPCKILLVLNSALKQNHPVTLKILVQTHVTPHHSHPVNQEINTPVEELNPITDKTQKAENEIFITLCTRIGS